MGAYWTLSVNGFGVFDGKNTIDSSLLLLFDPKDLQVRRRTAIEEDDDSEFEKYQYSCQVGELRDRLDLMGFSLRRTSMVYEEGRNEALKAAESEQQGSAELELLRSCTFRKWVAAIKRVMHVGWPPYVYGSMRRRPRTIGEFMVQNELEDAVLGFITTDVRYVLRACLEVADPDAKVVLDLSELVNAEYMDSEPNHHRVFSDYAIEYSRTTPVIVLTEGSSDRLVLSTTLPLVYPHLAAFFAFMDFEGTQSPGGAPHLVTTLKSFAGSGIRNRILAVFDNDTAARVALRGISDVTLPPNIDVCLLPEIATARSYPTIGPNGHSISNVNGKACSIEMFFGSDVLGQGKGRSPVRWAGYDQALKQYQGEITGKHELLNRFRRKTKDATVEEVKASPRWRDIRHLWAHLKTKAEVMSLGISQRPG